jgi:hypothetical protein
MMVLAFLQDVHGGVRWRYGSKKKWDWYGAIVISDLCPASSFFQPLLFLERFLNSSFPGVLLAFAP